MADRVAVMRDGLILQDGPPAHIYDRPVDPWVASFIGHMNFLPGRVEEVGDTGRRPARAGPGPARPAARRASRRRRAGRCSRSGPERIWLRAARSATAVRRPSMPGRASRAPRAHRVHGRQGRAHRGRARRGHAPHLGTQRRGGRRTAAPGTGEEVVVGWTRFDAHASIGEEPTAGRLTAARDRRAHPRTRGIGCDPSTTSTRASCVLERAWTGDGSSRRRSHAGCPRHGRQPRRRGHSPPRREPGRHAQPRDLAELPQPGDPRRVHRRRRASRSTSTVYGSTEEMEAKIRAGNSGIDVVVPSQYAIEGWTADGLLEPLDYSRLPGVDLATGTRCSWTRTFDPGNAFTIPKNWGTTGIAFWTDEVTPAPASWADFFRMAGEDAYKGRFLIVDHQISSMGSAAVAMGYSLNTIDETELNAVADMLIALKPKLFAIRATSSRRCATTTRWRPIAWTGDGVAVVRDNPDDRPVRRRQRRRRAVGRLVDDRRGCARTRTPPMRSSTSSSSPRTAPRTPSSACSRMPTRQCTALLPPEVNGQPGHLPARGPAGEADHRRPPRPTTARAPGDVGAHQVRPDRRPGHRSADGTGRPSCVSACGRCCSLPAGPVVRLFLSSRRSSSCSCSRSGPGAQRRLPARLHARAVRGDRRPASRRSSTPSGTRPWAPSRASWSRTRSPTSSPHAPATVRFAAAGARGRAALDELPHPDLRLDDPARQQRRAPDLGRRSGLGRLVLLNTPFAVVLGIVYNYLPLMVLPLFVSLERLDHSLLEGSRDLGAGPFATFRQITLPLSLPGIVSGCLLVFIPVMGEYLIPVLLGGGKTYFLGNALADLFLQSRNWPFGSALGTAFVAMMLVVVGAVRGSLTARLARASTGRRSCCDGPRDPPALDRPRPPTWWTVARLRVPVPAHRRGHRVQLQRRAGTWRSSPASRCAGTRRRGPTSSWSARCAPASPSRLVSAVIATILGTVVGARDDRRATRGARRRSRCSSTSRSSCRASSSASRRSSSR